MLADGISGLCLRSRIFKTRKFLKTLLDPGKTGLFEKVHGVSLPVCCDSQKLS